MHVCLIWVMRIVGLYNIVACSRKPEYPNQSVRLLLDNGSVTRLSVSLSR
jgi:hypothetical protein